MRDSFTTAEVAKILGKTPRFVIDWTERGLFHADIQPASGPGSKRLFSYLAVLSAALVFTLKEKLELPRDIVRLVALWLRQDKIIWPWHSDEAVKKYDPAMLKRMDEEHKRRISAEFEKSINGTFIFEILDGNEYSFWFTPNKMVELAANAEAMICVDLSRIKALVDKGIEEVT